MEQFEDHNSKRESWEIVKDLDQLSDEELASRLREYSQPELEAVKGACYKADPGGSSGADGGIHIVRANAARADMSLPDFRRALDRIADVICTVEHREL